MNLNVWTVAVSSYLAGLNSADLKTYHPATVLDEISAQIENFYKFIQFVSMSEDLYKSLFDIYNKSIQLINAAVERKFEKMRADPTSELPSRALTLKQLFPQDSGDHKELDQYLEMLDDFYMLLSMYTYLGGLKDLYDDAVKHLLTREKILSDCFNRSYRGPNWSDSQGFSEPYYFQTIRTAIVSLMEKPVFVGLARQAGEVTIRMNAFSLNGRPHIYIMAEHSQSFQLILFDIQANQLRNLTDPTLGVAGAIAAVKLHNEVFTVAGQPWLYQLLTTATKSKLTMYVPHVNKWYLLPDVPRHGTAGAGWGNKPKTTVVTQINGRPMNMYFLHETQKWISELDVPKDGSADWDNALKTIIMEVNGREMFCKVSVDTTHFRIDSYDTTINTWLPPALTPVGKESGYDLRTLTTAALTVNGQQNLYIAIWHTSGFQLTEFDPRKNTFKLLKGLSATKENGFNEPVYRTTFQIQAIMLHGHQKLLAMVKHKMGYQKYLYAPQTDTWKNIGAWPEFKDDWGWHLEKYYTTIQTNVVNITPNHQCLFITARDANGLGCYLTHISPQLFALSSEVEETFLQKLKRMKQEDASVRLHQSNEINVLHMIKMQVELWKENIAVLNKRPEKPKAAPTSQPVNDELLEIVKLARVYCDRLSRFSSNVTDAKEIDGIKEKCKKILSAIEQLHVKQNPAMERTLLNQLRANFNDIDATFNDLFEKEKYRLSQNIQSFLKLIREYMKTTAKQASGRVSEFGKFKFTKPQEGQFESGSTLRIPTQ